MRKLIISIVVLLSAGLSEAAFIPSVSVSTGNYTFIGWGRNRIVNGGMRIDQRNEGALAVAISSTGLTNWVTDHWVLVSTQARMNGVRQSSATPTGFTHFAQIFTASATVATSTMSALFGQAIEGTYLADIGWGKAAAKTVNVSFYVKSSSAGVFGAALTNEGRNRSYPFTYTINTSSAWEHKSIAIPGDTTGTWATDNGAGIWLRFDLGSGTPFRGTALSWAASDLVGVTGTGAPSAIANSSWCITGVQLEVSSAPTNFELRPDPVEYSLCWRYYQKTFRAGTKPGYAVSNAGALAYRVTVGGTLTQSLTFIHNVPMRASGTRTFYNTAASNSNWRNLTDGADSGAATAESNTTSEYRTVVQNAQAAGDTAGELVAVQCTVDAESGL